MKENTELTEILKDYLTILIKDKKELKSLLLSLKNDPLNFIKKLLRTRFELFAYWGLKTLCNIEEVFGFVPNKDDEYAYLQELAEFFYKVTNGDGRYFLINMPPRFGKTEMIKLFIIWAFGRNPFCKILYLCYSEALASDGVAKISSFMKHPAYKSIFPNVIIDKNLDNKTRFQTLVRGRPAGELYSAGVTGSITGFGAGNQASIKTNKFRFSGAVVIDDPIKPQDAKSVITRENTWEAIQSTILSRKNMASVPVIMVMQRLDIEDPSGKFILRFKNNEDFRHLCLKALQDNGKAICEVKMPVKDLKELEVHNPETFYSQYQQEPVLSSNKIFDTGKIRIISDSLEDNLVLKSFITVDTAEKDTKTSDFSVFGHFYLVAVKNWRDYAIFGRDGRQYLPEFNDGKIIKLVLNEIYVKRIPAYSIGEEFDIFFREIIKTSLLKPSIVLIEEQGSGLGLIGHLKKHQTNQKFYYGNQFLVTGIRQTNNKILRMRSVSQLVTDGVLWVNSECNRNFVNFDSKDMAIINHMDAIENRDNKKDDIADVITYGLQVAYQGIESSDNKFLGNFFTDAKNILSGNLLGLYG